MEATFTTKGQQTKAIKKILGAGFSVKTNACGSMVFGDLKEAQELLGGFGFKMYNMADTYLLLAMD